MMMLASWDDHYQHLLDKFYWKNGQCCAGCDHWRSDSGFTGECTAAPIVSGDEVLRSMGITWSTYKAAPGHPFTEAGFHCGAFKDDFDWSSLGEFYLRRIGAMVGKRMQPKPRQPSQVLR